MRAGVGLVALATVVLVGVSNADADELRLAVELDESCPPAEVVAEQLRALIDADAEVRLVVLQAHASLSIEARGGVLVGTLSFADYPGEARHLEAPTGACAVLVDALLLAASLGPDRPSAPESPSPNDVGERPPAADSSPAELVSSVAPVRAPRTRVELYGGLTASGGTAPEISPGLRAGVAFQWSAGSLGLEARLDAPSERALEQGSVSVQLSTASLVPCVTRGAAGACAVGCVGLVRGQGAGFAGASSAATPYAAAGLRLQAKTRLANGWMLVAHADGLGVVAGTVVRADEMVVWETERLATSFGISASYQIW